MSDDDGEYDRASETQAFMDDNNKMNSNIKSSHATDKDRKSARLSKRFSMIANEEGLTLFTGILALISTCVGGGIVGLPHAFLYLGIPLAILLNVAVIVATIYTISLYLGLKDAVPDKPESLYEIGYMINGRSSIFVIASLVIVNSLGLCMIYFITFGDTMGQVVASFIDGASLDSDWYTSRFLYIIILAAFLVIVILKKELAELEWISIVLFVSLGLFVLLNIVQLFFDNRFVAAQRTEEFWYPNKELDTIGALSVVMLAYAYQQNIFIIF